VASSPHKIGRMGGGLAIDIEGLKELGADLEMLGKNGLREAMRRSLRGPGGEALAAEMRGRVPIDSGRLRSRIGVHDGTRFERSHDDDVLVGYDQSDNRGAWVETGVKSHLIETKINTTSIRSGRLGHRKTIRISQDKSALSFNGEAWANVYHPGYRGKKVAQRSMAAASWEVLADIVDQVDGIISERGAA
jgi:hypothetical protein